MARLKWISDLVRNVDQEWAAKIIILIGIWIWGPLFGGIELQANVSVYHLIGGSLAVIFANRFYDDLVETMQSADGS